MRAGLWLLVGLLLGQAAWAGEVLLTVVERHGDRYRVEVDTRMRATPERIRGLLIDFPNLGRINDSIHTVEVVRQTGVTGWRIRTQSTICVAFVCREIRQTQDVIQSPDGDLVATVLPEESDFSYGVARWYFFGEPGTTRMRFIAEVEPAFWVPPLIGPWLIQRALRQEALKSVQNLERLAEAPNNDARP